MNKVIVALVLFLGFSGWTFGQTHQQRIREANLALESTDYQTSLKLFKGLHAAVNRNDSSFKDVVYGLSASLFYLIGSAKNNNDWQKTIDLSTEFIEVLEKDSAFLRPQLVAKKYWAYKDLVVAYFGLGQWDKAKPCQAKLYTAYNRKELPEGIDKYYNFEKFVFNNQNVWGYEWFAQLGDKESEGSFSKHVYYIYSRDSVGKDKDQLFTLHTVKVHKVENAAPDFVLTKRTYNGSSEQSETIWTYTFDDPVDYLKLHKAVVDFLSGKVKADTKTIIRR